MEAPPEQRQDGSGSPSAQSLIERTRLDGATELMDGMRNIRAAGLRSLPIDKFSDQVGSRIGPPPPSSLPIFASAVKHFLLFRGFLTMSDFCPRR